MLINLHSQDRAKSPRGFWQNGLVPPNRLYGMQSALCSKTSLQAMKDWHKIKPELFKKQPYYRPAWQGNRVWVCLGASRSKTIVI